jgi:hypothetical protein
MQPHLVNVIKEMLEMITKTAVIDNPETPPFKITRPNDEVTN